MTEGWHVAVPGLLKYWEGRHAERLDWAARAHQVFLQTLETETQAGLLQAGSGESYVAVYGKTQVGKTSLILELMGVAPDAQERVSEVLRGGRAAANSATIMATAYRRSADNCWRLRDAHGNETSYPQDESMTHALATIRTQMDSRMLVTGAVCTICIPADCFPAEPSAIPAVRMLDLPGAEACDEVERDYVREVAQKYLPGADLILLVCRADDLGFLKSGALAVPGIEDWLMVPERFRVVTTYSFTPGSLNELALQSLDALDAGLFRKRLFEQLATHEIVLGDAAFHPERFYPLEFGRSWCEGLQGPLAELLQALTPMLEGLKEALRQDMAVSGGKYARLQNACRAHEVAVRVKRRQLRWHNAAVASAAARLETLGQQKRSREQALARLLQEKTRLHKLLGQFPRSHAHDVVRSFAIGDRRALADSVHNQLGLSERSCSYDSYDELVEVVAGQERVQSFKRLLGEFASALCNDALARGPRSSDLPCGWPWRRELPDLTAASRHLRELVDDALAEVRRVLNGHSFDSYFPAVSSSLERDRAQIVQALHAASLAVDKFVFCLWMAKVHATRAALKGDLDALDRYIASDRFHLVQVGDEAAVQADALVTARGERTLFEARLERDEQSSGRFVEILDLHYLRDLRERWASLSSCANPALRLLDLLACRQVIDERMKLMEHLQ